MRRFVTCLLLLILSSLLANAQAPSNDDCANAQLICRNQTVSTATTANATSEPGQDISCDPGELDNNVWYQAIANVNGNITVTILGIDSADGLELDVYSSGDGTCNTLVATGTCTSQNGPAGIINETFAVIAGTTYFIMVDGVNGNEENFTISITGDAVGKPVPSIQPDKNKSCIGDIFTVTNNTTEYGGSITYEWNLGSGYFTTGITSGQDTPLVYSTAANNDVLLRATNECGSNLFGTTLTSQEMIASITAVDPKCVGTPAMFISNATLTPGSDNPSISSWQWRFTEVCPGSGLTTTNQTINSGVTRPDTTSYTPCSDSVVVRLIAFGTCGPDTVTSTIVINETFTTSLADTVTTCFGNDANFCITPAGNNGPYTYSWSGGPPAANPLDSNCTVVSGAPIGQHKYNVTVTDTIGCVVEDSIIVDVSNSVNASVNIYNTPLLCGVFNAFCSGDTVRFRYQANGGTAPYTLSWTPNTQLWDTILTSGTAVDDSAYTIARSATYRMYVTDAQGCQDSADMAIPLYSTTVATSSICIAELDTATFMILNTCGASTFDWTLSAPLDTLLLSTNASTVQADFTKLAGQNPSPGPYLFRVRVTNPACSGDTIVSFNYYLDTIPALTLSASDTQICAGGNATLTVSGDTAGVTYTWFENGNAIPGSDTFRIAVTPADTSTYRVVGSRNACDFVDSVQIDVIRPVAAITSVDSVCACDTVQLDGTNSSQGPFSYQWTSSAGNSIVNDTLDSTQTRVCNTGTYTLRVTSTDVPGCFTDSVKTIKAAAFPGPVINIDPDTVCSFEKDTVRLNAKPSTGNDLSYTWTASRPVTIGDNNADSTYALVDTVTTFYLMLQDTVLGCTRDDSVTIQMHEDPTIMALPNSFCSTDSPKTSALCVLGVDQDSLYNWDVSPDKVFITGQKDSVCADVTFTPWDTLGTFVFRVDVVDGRTGCRDTIQYSFPVRDSASITSVTATPDTICAGQSSTLLAAGTSNYAWSMAPGSPNDPSLIGQDSVANPSVSPPAVGGVITTYTYRVIGYEGSGANGCVDTVSLSLTVIPLPTAIAGTDDSICQGTNYTLINGNGGPGTISWSDNGKNGSFMPFNFVLTPTYWPDADSAGPHQLIMTVTEGTGTCAVSDTMDLFIDSLPIANAGPDPPAICQGDTTANLNGSMFGDSLKWSDGGSSGTFVGGDTILNPRYYAGAGFSGSRDLYLTVYRDGLCPSVTDTVTITVNPTPTVDAGPNVTRCQGDTFTLGGAPTGPPGSVYSWSPATGLNNTTAENPDAAPDDTTTYTVLVTDPNGCQNTDNVTLNIIPTPNLSFSFINDPNLTCAGAGFCPWDSIPFEYSVSAGAQPYTLIWNPDFRIYDKLNFSATPFTDTAVFFTDSTLSYTIRVVDGFACTDDTTITINILSPTASATPLCILDSPAVSTFSISGTCPATVFDWSQSPNSGIITHNNPTDTFAVANFTGRSAGNYNFMVLVNDPAKGCSGLDTVRFSFTLDTLVTVSLTAGTTDLCSGDSTTLELTSNDTSGFSYTWIRLPADTMNETSNPIVVKPSVTTTYKIVANKAGCDVADSIIINVIPPLVISAQASQDSVCRCDTFTLNGTGSTTNNMSFQWTSDRGGLMQNADSIATVAQLCADDSFTLTITDTLYGCSKDTTIGVVAIPTPDAFVTATPDTICLGVPTVITLNGAGSATGAGIGYSWTTNPAVLVNNSDSIVATATIDSIVTFTLTVMDSAAGCDSSYSVTIRLYPRSTIVPDNPAFCTADSPRVSNLCVVGAGVGAIYDWSISPDVGFITGLTTDSCISVDLTAAGAGTYEFTVADSNTLTGCWDTLSYTIPIVDSIDINVSQNRDTVCEGDTTMLIASGGFSYTWSAVPGDPSLTGQTTNDTIIVRPLALGGLSTVYTYKALSSTGGCSDSVEVTVTVLPNFQVQAGADTTICLGDTAQLGGSPTAPGVVTYQWSPSTDLSSTTEANPLAYPSSNITYYVTATDPNACAYSDTVEVEVVTLPQLTVTLLQQPAPTCAGTGYCPNDSVPFRYSVTGGVPPFTINWTPVKGLFDTLQSAANNFTDNAYIRTDSSTVFQISVTDGSGNNCTVDTTININILRGRPIVNTVCTADSPLTTIFRISGTCPGAIFDWSQSPNNNILTHLVPSDTFVEANFTGMSPGVYNFMVLINEPAKGCGGLDTITFNYILDTLISIQGQPIDSFCADAPDRSETICLLDVSSNAVIDWTVSPAQAYITSATNDTCATYNLNAAPPGSYTFCAEVFSPFSGCIDTLCHTVVVRDSVKAGISFNTDSLCEGDTLILAAGGGNSYTWSSAPSDPGLPGQATSDSVVLFPVPPGQGDTIFTYTLSGTISGCSDTTTTNIFVRKAPTADAGLLDSICQGTSKTLNQATASGGAPTWSDGGRNGTFSASPNILNPAYFPHADTTGLVTLTLTVTDTSGFCASVSDSVIIYVDTIPVIDTVYSDRDTICSNDTLILTGTVRNIDSIIWNDGNAGGQFIPSPNIQSPQYLPPAVANDTTIQLRLRGYDDLCGQIASAIIDLRVIEVPIASIDTSGNICIGDTLQLSATVNLGSPQWDDGGAGGTFIPSASTLNARYYNSVPGTYTLILTSMNTASAITCSANPDSVAIEIYPLPVINVSASDTDICQGELVRLSATGGQSYVWREIVPPSVLTLQPTDSVINVYPNDTATYRAIGMDGNGCEDSAFVVVNTRPNPKPSAIADYDARQCYPTEVNFSYNVNKPAWLNIQDNDWIFGDGNTSTEAGPTYLYGKDPSVNYPVTYNVRLNVTYDNGCSNSDTVDVTICEEQGFYNVFTPNGDGVNDYFVIAGFYGRGCDLFVYNRWGKKVYDHQNYDNTWDGQDHAGRPLKSDVYYYIFRCADDDSSYTGWVKIIRGEQ